MDVSLTFSSFSSANQLPGFFVGGTLVAIGLMHQRIFVLDTFCIVPPCAYNMLQMLKTTIRFISRIFVLYNPFAMVQIHFQN